MSAYEILAIVLMTLHIVVVLVIALIESTKK